MPQLDFQFDVRIPRVLIQQMMDREITPAMLLTMSVLYMWSDWNTGRVRWCSSGGLRTATHKAYSDRTFRVSLQRLEEMGWITRHITPGSHDDYPVTLHNYKFVDDAERVHILNPKDIRVRDPFAGGGRRETSHEGSQENSHERSQETSQETSQKVLLKNELNNEVNHEFENQFDHEPQQQLTNEQTNESTSPAARAAVIDSSVVSNSNRSSEVEKLRAYWQEQTSYGFQPKDYLAAQTLVDQHGLTLVMDVLHNTLTERAKSAEVGWRDFWFFADKWDYNHDKFLAWKRVGKAKSKSKATSAAAPSSHAAKNPELHMGLNALGKSLVKDAARFCGTPRCEIGLHKPCEPCRVGGISQGFDVDDIYNDSQSAGAGFDVEEA